jgi:hypothetical protein
VVRTPERWLPYASTLHFYASFHSTGTRYTLDNAYIKEMLNHYKNTIWSIYDVLAKKEYDINYIPDQKITIPENTDNGAKTALTISCENWQTDTPISTYFNSRKGAILCITSLNDVQDIASMLDNCDAGTTVYFIKLSRTFRHFVPFTWIQRLLFLPPQDRLSRLRSKWIFSPLSFQVRKKEKEIELLLKSCNATTAIL